MNTWKDGVIGVAVKDSHGEQEQLVLFVFDVEGMETQTRRVSVDAETHERLRLKAKEAGLRPREYLKQIV